MGAARAKAPARVAVVVVLLVDRLEMLTQLHVQLKVVVLVVLLVELLVEPLAMLVQLHVQLKVLVLVVLLPRLLEMLAHRRRALALRPAVPVACGGPRWALPAAPLEVAALPEAVILAVGAS